MGDVVPEAFSKDSYAAVVDVGGVRECESLVIAGTRNGGTDSC